MALIDKEKIRMFAIQKSTEMMQNPMVMQAMQSPKIIHTMVKVFEHSNKTKTIIDNTVNKMAKSFNLVVKK